MKRVIIYGSALLVLLCTCGNVADRTKNDEKVQAEQRVEAEEKKPEGTVFFNISLLSRQDRMTVYA